MTRLKWKLISVRLEIVPNVLEAHKSFWTHSKVPLGDEAQVDAHFGTFGDSANLDAR